jgi:hypothetical protein
VLVYSLYKVVHLLGMVLVFMALGGALALSRLGADRTRARKWLAMTHGAGVLLLLVTGFGMLARMGLHWPLPGWVWGKVALWLTGGALLTVALRHAHWARGLWWAVPVVAVLAAFLGVAKP